MSTPLLIARTLEKELYLLPAMANRHGLITGATGTGENRHPAKAGGVAFGDWRTGLYG